jgi:AraC-like DNA-binding protein
MFRAEIRDREHWMELVRQTGFSANVVCKQLHVCRRQLQRYTRRDFGQSAQHWLNAQRLGVAAAMLRRGWSVKRTALELGFKQPNHFSRQFKRVYGLCPSAFATQEGCSRSNLDACRSP